MMNMSLTSSNRQNGAVLYRIRHGYDIQFHFRNVYTQMFNVLCDKAPENGGALKTHVTCLPDEFANQKIPNFQHLISVIRIAAIENGHIDRDTEDSIKQRLVAALFKFRFDGQEA